MNLLKQAYEKRKAAKQAKKDAEKAQFKNRNAAADLAILRAKTRKPAEVLADFQGVCATAGNLQYKIEIDKQTLELYNRRLFELQNENKDAQKVWSEEAPAPTPEVKPEEPKQPDPAPITEPEQTQLPQGQAQNEASQEA